MKSSWRRPGHEAAAGVGDGRRHVDQLDAALEAEALRLAVGPRRRGGGACGCCACSDDDEQHASGDVDGAQLLRSWRLIHVRDDAFVGPEADAVPADVARRAARVTANVDSPPGRSAGDVDGGAAAGEESAVRREQQDDRGRADPARRPTAGCGRRRGRSADRRRARVRARRARAGAPARPRRRPARRPAACAATRGRRTSVTRRPPNTIDGRDRAPANDERAAGDRADGERPVRADGAAAVRRAAVAHRRAAPSP